MIDTKIKQRILEAVDSNFDSQLALTADLVRIPSQRGEEATAQDFMATAYRERDLSVDRWKINLDDIRDLPGFSPASISYDNAYNTVGTWRASTQSGKSLILNGHIDVVPNGPLEFWDIPPYQPDIIDGWMNGRGAGDMKAGLIANIAAFDAIRLAGFEPTADIYLQSVVEEECTGNGALACLQRGYRADAAIIPEPMPQLIRAQVGVLWFSVEVLGHPVHASGAHEQGVNAIEKTYVVIEALKKLESEWNAQKAQHAPYHDHPHPIRLNIGKIAGGEWTSSVPAYCRLDVRLGVYPGLDLNTVKAEIKNYIKTATAADSHLAKHPPIVKFDDGFASEGYVLEPGSPAEQTLRLCHFDVFGEELQEVATSATTDARFFGLYQNTPALVYGPESRNIHSYNEAVNIESIRQITKTIALFIANWCGVRERT